MRATLAAQQMHHLSSDVIRSEAIETVKLRQNRPKEFDSNPGQINLLAISFAYPPMLEPRAVQVSRLLRHLEASTVLVCADCDDPTPKDLMFVGEAESHLERLVRVPFSRSKSRRIASSLLGQLKVPLWDKCLDHMRSWQKPVVNAVENLISRDHYQPELLVTFAYPLTDFLIGLELKRRFGLPWVAHFSDPWTDNPSSHLDPISRAVHRRVERKVVEAADRLVFTSEETVELVMGKYPANLREKSRVVPHAFEPALFSRRNEDHSPKIMVRYLGTLYGRRTPEPLFEALKRLLVLNPELLTDVCFEIVGDTCGLNLDEMGLRNLPEGLVTITSQVDYLKSVDLMVSADGLLVIDAPARQSVFLPSKLIDYVGTGRPILGITPPGAAARLIERLGGWVADPADVEATTEAVREFLTYIRSKRSAEPTIWGDPDVRRAYEAKGVAESFNRVLEELR